MGETDERIRPTLVPRLHQAYLTGWRHSYSSSRNLCLGTWECGRSPQSEALFRGEGATLRTVSSRDLAGNNLLYPYLQKEWLEDDIWLFQMLTARPVTALVGWFDPVLFNVFR